MSFASKTENAWKESWINDFSNNVKLANELNNAYADDVIQAVEEKDFDTLESALEDLRVRIGVSKTAMKDIKKIALAKLNDKQADDHGKACTLEVSLKKEEEIPGNKSVAGDRLVKESPAVEASTTPDVVAGGMNPGFKAYLDKKKEEKEGKKSEEGDKEERAADKKAAFEAKKKAWFQGAKTETVEGPVTSNDPDKLGYPKEMGYEKKPMETTAPGGQDSRPAEQAAFEGAAAETKKELGPAGEEFKLKVEQQRIPEGEKEANASAKWSEAFKKSGDKKAAAKVNALVWKQTLSKKN